MLRANEANDLHTARAGNRCIKPNQRADAGREQCLKVVNLIYFFLSFARCLRDAQSIYGRESGLNAVDSFHWLLPSSVGERV